jgi:two-component system response regulator
MSRPTILLVEDSIDDVELAEYALARCRVANQVVVASSGEQALNYLFGKEGGDKDGTYPDLVLLDLQLPGISGLEVLRRIRQDPALRRLLVVALTTSDDQRDIVASYDLGVNSYIRKPVDLAEFTTVIDQLGAYWLVTNTGSPV